MYITYRHTYIDMERETEGNRERQRDRDTERQQERPLAWCTFQQNDDHVPDTLAFLFY